MLSIQNLHARVAETPILRGISLELPQGQVHAIMGPNGSGKSTLAALLAGRDTYECSSGSVRLDEKNLLEMSPEERAHAGLFLAFQYPVEIPGLSCINFLRTAVNETRKARGEKEMSALDFLKLIKERAKQMHMDTSFLQRGLNEGFSGGEKKKLEILQMSVLEPRLAILDETDSGLDIDALRIVSEGVNRLRSSKRSILLITHYQRVLDYIEPDVVHIMYKGRIVKSGDKILAQMLEKEGYAGVIRSEVTSDL